MKQDHPLLQPLDQLDKLLADLDTWFHDHCRSVTPAGTELFDVGNHQQSRLSYHKHQGKWSLMISLIQDDEELAAGQDGPEEKWWRVNEAPIPLRLEFIYHVDQLATAVQQANHSMGLQIDQAIAHGRNWLNLMEAVTGNQT